jgi:hypothetical protein
MAIPTMEYPPFVLPFDQSTKPATIKPTHERVASSAVDSATGDISYTATETDAGAEAEAERETDIWYQKTDNKIITDIFGGARRFKLGHRKSFCAHKIGYNELRYC